MYGWKGEGDSCRFSIRKDGFSVGSHVPNLWDLTGTRSPTFILHPVPSRYTPYSTVPTQEKDGNGEPMIALWRGKSRACIVCTAQYTKRS
mmetsp:Transcript_14576/g.29747  ORF Transcript_14576/g.29747 Transcript_14576/m.29747 type:complete len:90 (-) Transcript_14576:2443-2712(-)